jgi:hypothetical protein
MGTILVTVGYLTTDANYLINGISKCIVVVIECRIYLRFTPCSQNSNDLFVIVLFLRDLLMKYFSL